MKPVYDFLNFRLVKVSYSRTEDDLPLITEINATITAKDKLIFTLETNVLITFSTGDTSSLVFTSVYRINDLNWEGNLTEEQLTSILFSAVFPFIREKIFNLTSDSRTPIMLPVIDLRNSNIKSGVKFERRGK